MKIGIAGGGLVGLLLAWRVAKTNTSVEIFDAGKAHRCAHAAAGMLGPTVELINASKTISELGLTSINLWNKWLEDLKAPKNTLVQKGSIIVAHRRDKSELERVANIMRSKTPNPDGDVVLLDAKALIGLEPCLEGFDYGYHFPNEAHLNVDTTLELLEKAVIKEGVAWHSDQTVDEIAKGSLKVGQKNLKFDWCCDCRGLGSSGTLPLRPVRGEIFFLKSEQVKLSRPVRIMHPQQSIYLVPRNENQIIIGATEIESSSKEQVTVRSALELLGSAYAFIPVLGEANIVESRVGLRPALPNNEPEVTINPGMVSINGMYRHGYLASPACVNNAIAKMGLA